MKRILLATFALGLTMASFAQNDTTSGEKVDTIKIGGMIIIKKPGANDTAHHKEVSISTHRHNKQSNLSTNWVIMDFGFANFNDKTNYSNAATQAFAPGSTADEFNLRNGKSVNVNLWLFMQRLNLIKHAVNLKYGLGVELNNYRFDDTRITFHKNPTLITLDPLKDVKKNKLAADYVTVPMMLNFNFTPNKDKTFGFSAGMSAGYLYSARQKTKDNDNKVKLHDDFNLRPWKFSYIGELNLGVVRFYGSYALKSMWEKGLDQTPYNFGIRFASW